MQVLTIVITALLCSLILLLLLAAVAWVYIDMRRRQKAMIEGMGNLTLACRDVRDNLYELAKTPAYLSGITKVCGDFVLSIRELNAAVEKFRTAMFSPEDREAAKLKDAEDRAAWKPYKDEDADKAWEINNLVENAGMTFEEAKDRVEGSRRFTLG